MTVEYGQTNAGFYHPKRSPSIGRCDFDVTDSLSLPPTGRLVLFACHFHRNLLAWFDYA